MVDLTPFADLLPIFSFLVVFALIIVVLQKTKLVEDIRMQIGISFIISLMFVTATGARVYLQSIIPFFAVLLVCLFFVLVFIAFVGKDVEKLSKEVGIGFVAILLIVFVGTALFWFGPGASPYYERFRDSPKVYGATVLIATAAAVAWILVRAKGK